MTAYFGDNVLDGNRFAFATNRFANNPFCQIDVHVTLKDNGLCQQRVDDTFQFTYAFVDVFGNVVYYRFRNIQSVTANLVAENILSQFHIRLFQFGYQTPFKTGQEAFFHTLQHHRCAVGSQDKLLTVLVQVVKDMEEGILSFGNTGKFLDIIDNQHIYCLVETDEIIEMVCTYRVGILYLKQMCRYI